MTAVCCRVCADELYDSQHAMEHRLTTGHNDAAVVTTECPPGIDRRRPRRCPRAVRAGTTGGEA